MGFILYLSTRTRYTYPQNMLRFVIGALLLSTTVLGAVQPNRDARQFQPQQGVPYQGDNVQARQGFGGNVDLTTPFGGAGINANVGLPSSGNNLLTTAVIGLGVLSLVNTVATIVIPFFKGDKKETETGTDDTDTDARSMRNLFPQKTIDTLENAVIETLLKAK